MKKVKKLPPKSLSKIKNYKAKKNLKATTRILQVRSHPKNHQNKIYLWKPKTKWRSWAETRSEEALTKVLKFMLFLQWSWERIGPRGWLRGECLWTLMTQTKTLALNLNWTVKKIQTMAAPTPQISARDSPGGASPKVVKLVDFWINKTRLQVLIRISRELSTILQKRWTRGPWILTNQMSQNP